MSFNKENSPDILERPGFRSISFAPSGLRELKLRLFEAEAVGIIRIITPRNNHIFYKKSTVVTMRRIAEFDPELSQELNVLSQERFFMLPPYML